MIYYSVFIRDILITKIDCEISYADFLAEIKDICKFDDNQSFTVKWVDEEGLFFVYSYLRMYVCPCLNLHYVNCSKKVKIKPKARITCFTSYMY